MARGSRCLFHLFRPILEADEVEPFILLSEIDHSHLLSPSSLRPPPFAWVGRRATANTLIRRLWRDGLRQTPDRRNLVAST